MKALEARALLAARFPAIGGGSVRRLGEGDFFHAFRVDDAWVARVAKHPRAAEALAREVCLLPALAPRLPLRVPEPVLAPPGEGPAFAVHRLLAGPALTRRRYLALPGPARDRCAGQVAGFLAALHALEPPAGCALPAADPRGRYLPLLDALAHLPEPERAFAERELRAFEAAEDPPAVLLHGDLSPDHVLFDPEAGAVTGIIDFGDAATGDPAWDFVYLMEDYGDDFLARALAAYPAADQEGLLARARRFLVLDAIEWAVRCDPEERAKAAAYLRKLRR